MPLADVNHQQLLEKMERDGDRFLVQLSIPCGQIDHWLTLLDSLATLSSDMCRGKRLAESANRWKEQHQAKVDARDMEIRGRVRARYKEVFEQVRSEREAMKVITAEFSEYWWIRKAFREEVEVARDLEIVRLHGTGLNSK